jgi:hypothetical protein
MGASHRTQSPRGWGQCLITLGRAVAALVIPTAAIVGVLIALPSTSVIAMGTCARLDVVCRADAHQGVVAGLALVIALVAGLFAYLSLRGERLEQRRVQTRYERLLGEMLYEAVHNLRHLTEVIGWAPPTPPGANEYERCTLAAWPTLDFRYAERLLEIPYVDKLQRDAPAVIGFLDHALRNARFIDRQDPSPAGLTAAAKPAVWMTEHILRVLVCVRYRSGDGLAQRAREVLNAELYAEMNPGPPRPGIASETELRDVVRLVRLERRRDRRALDTTIALFEPEGPPAQLFRSLRSMPDPPARPPWPTA